jgi:hypothetical protein
MCDAPRAALGVFFLAATALAQTEWRSTLYPETWTPPEIARFESDRLIQDFSYAGYGRGERDIPTVRGPVFDVTSHGADPTGAADSTVAIQNAIDAAVAAGGGVVFLPAGTFRVSPQGGNAYALRLAAGSVVFRGAGLDPVSVEIVKEKAQAELARGKLILVTSHILSDLDEIATDVLYLIEGRMRLYRSIAELKAESGESRLDRVVARIARTEMGGAGPAGEGAP